MKRILILSMIIITVLFGNFNLKSQQTGSFQKHLQIAGVSRTIDFYVPVDYDGTKKIFR